MEKREKIIHDKMYSLLLPSPLKALPICTRTAVLISPLISQLIGFLNIEEGVSFKEQAIQMLVPLVHSASETLSKTDPIRLQNLLVDAADAAKLSCNGEMICSPAHFEKHFSQYPGDMFPALIWCLWECVKDFFPELEAFSQEVMTPVPEKS